MSSVGMEIRSVEVDGQLLRVGIRPGSGGTPPLLIFNVIGANLELVEPCVAALEGVETIIFDVPASGGRLCPPALPTLAPCPYGRRASCEAGLSRASRHNRGFLGRRSCARVRAPLPGSLLPTDPRLHLSRRDHGAGQALGARQADQPAPLLGSKVSPRRRRAICMVAPTAAIRSCCASTAGPAARRRWRTASLPARGRSVSPAAATEASQLPRVRA